MLNDDTKITVCDACLTAACWLYTFPCERAVQAGTAKRTVAELRTLDREHPCYWLQALDAERPIELVGGTP
jgi:hypothetical protein